MASADWGIISTVAGDMTYYIDESQYKSSPSSLRADAKRIDGETALKMGRAFYCKKTETVDLIAGGRLTAWVRTNLSIEGVPTVGAPSGSWLSVLAPVSSPNPLESEALPLGYSLGIQSIYSGGAKEYRFMLLNNETMAVQGDPIPLLEAESIWFKLRLTYWYIDELGRYAVQCEKLDGTTWSNLWRVKEFQRAKATSGRIVLRNILNKTNIDNVGSVTKDVWFDDVEVLKIV